MTASVISSWSQSFYSTNFLLELNDALKESKKEVKPFIKSYSYAKIVDKYEHDFITLKKHYDYIHDIFLIDKDGNIVIDKTGAANWNSEKVRNQIDALLAK